MALRDPSPSEYLESRRESRLKSYQNSPEDIAAHYSDEGQIQSDYHKRFAFELIQNADDAMKGVDGVKSVRFELNEGVLLVANTGRPIERDDVKALCTMSYTTKSTEEEKRASIGHKGRGFSSVLEITSKPQIFSNGISFEFDRERSHQEIRELVRRIDGVSLEELDGVPLMRLPFEPHETPDRVQELLANGYNTVFRFELKDDQVEQDVIDTIEKLGRNTVLFLQELDRLEFDLEGVSKRGWKINRESKSIDSSFTNLEFVSIHKIGDKESSKTFAVFSRDEIEIGGHTGGIDDNTWGNVNYTQIGLALRVEYQEDGIHLTRFESRPAVHVFLPTEERSPIPVLINGAFHTAISRTNINVTSDEDNYNSYLFQQVVELLATDVRKYTEKTATTIEEFIEYLDFTHLSEEQISDVGRIEGRFVEALKDRFSEVKFVPRLEKLTTGEILDDPGVKPIEDVVVPYYYSDGTDKQDGRTVAEAIALIYGNEKLNVEGVNNQGWFPKTTLLIPRRAAILEGLGAPVLEPEEVPVVLGSVPDENSPLIFPDEADELAVDPILQVLIWVWKSVTGDDMIVDSFKEAANNSAVFPVGNPNGGFVKHVSRDGGVEFFLPPRGELPDIELSGIRFLTPPVYRPQKGVEPARQSDLVEDIRPALEAIWDINEFDFEEVVQAGVFPKLASPRQQDADDSELRNENILGLIKQLSTQTIDEENPLPYVERDGSLHRLCLLPVPTRDGDWKPAYKVYFGEEWQPEATRERKIEPLLTAVDADAPFLAPPSRLPGDVEFRNDDESEEESEFDQWIQFFKWLGVSPHLRLKPLFEPHIQRDFVSTIGINRPENTSILSQLREEDWEAYQRHLITELDKSEKRRREYDSIYRIHGIEFLNQYLNSANNNKSVAELLFKHLASWWDDEFRAYRNSVLATHDVRSFGRRNKNCPKEREKRRVGSNLWLWQLKREPWAPSKQGQVKPENLWMPTKAVKNMFSIHSTVLLPVLSQTVLDEAAGVRDFLHVLGVRDDPDQSSFTPRDAEIVVDNVSRMFDGESQEVVSNHLRQIKAVYRYVSEHLPRRDSRGEITSTEWIDAKVQLQEIPVLSRINEERFEFEDAKDVYFVRSPDVLDRIPISGIPVFVLQEDEAARIGTYFGQRDLEKEADPNPEFIDERIGETEKIRKKLRELAPFILCRLEAERTSQDLINQDVNGMREFYRNMTIVDDIEVDYEFESGVTIPAEPDYFLDNRGRARTDRPLPFVTHSEDEKELNRYLARALCEYLGISQFEGVITLLDAASNDQRLQYLKLAGAPASETDIVGKKQDLSEEINTPAEEIEIELGDKDEQPSGYEENNGMETVKQKIQRREIEAQTHPVYEPDELSVNGEGIIIKTEGSDSPGPNEKSVTTPPDSSSSRGGVSAKYRSQVDRLGTWITLQYERNRLKAKCDNPDDFIFDIHDEDRYRKAKNDDGGIAGPALEDLEEKGLPELYPGFDILVVDPESGDPDRLIELKSSGHNSRSPGVTWNEWKTAMDPEIQELYYLYVVGNLRKDINSKPYLREIPNPFRLLNSETTERSEIKKEVKVNVYSFKEDAEIIETPISVTSDNSS